MPITPNFEEKEYESPLYRELAQDSPHLWTPGQVLEAHLGFDAVLKAKINSIWSILGVQTPIGFDLNRNSAIGFYKIVGISNSRVPDFNINLFIQAKRPQILHKRTHGLNKTSLTNPYWRIKINQSQQELLEVVANAVKDKAAVIYASPAFNSIQELTRHTLKGQVIDNSSFVDVSELVDHSYWAYDKAGGTGYKCSEPKFLSGKEISETINNLSQNAVQYDEQNLEALFKSITRLHQVMIEATSSSDLEDDPRIESFNMYREYIANIAFDNYSEIFTDFLELKALFSIMNLNWFVIGK